MGKAHDKLKEKLAGARGGFGWKPKDGENKIFVLPPTAACVDDLDALPESGLAHQFKGHYFRLGDGRPTEAAMCLASLPEAERCPACAMYRAHRDSNDPALKKMAGDVRAADQYMFNIIDLNDTAKGVQRWGANWTCWRAIMEIAANMDWGYVYDPRNGVPFNVTMTPGNRSKTGWNQYSVLPAGQNRLNVMPILEGLPGGVGALDGLDELPMEVKSAEEMESLLDAMGFPPPSRGGGGGGGRRPAPSPVAPPGTAPQPVTIPPASAPAPVPGTAPQPVTLPAPQSASASVAQPVAVAPQPAGPQAVTAVAVAAVPEASDVHYDPGPGYTPRVPEAERPDRAPRCFGDYRPQVHRCVPCPVRTDCTMRMLEIE